MRKLSIGVKTGFVVNDVTKPILIRDCRGLLFYETESLLPKVEFFNMPAGQYWVERGFFSETLLPRVYPLAVLPMPQRTMPDPSNFPIVFDSNPNKCSVFWPGPDEKGMIVFDNSFADKTEPEIFFVLYHEYGHQLYKTEKFADLFAANTMKIKGFNPSQIHWGQGNSLSDKQAERKQFIENKLIEDLTD